MKIYESTSATQTSSVVVSVDDAATPIGTVSGFQWGSDSVTLIVIVAMLIVLIVAVFCIKEMGRGRRPQR